MDFQLQTYPLLLCVGGAGTRQPTFLLCLQAPGYCRKEHKAERGESHLLTLSLPVSLPPVSPQQWSFSLVAVISVSSFQWRFQNQPHGTSSPSSQTYPHESGVPFFRGLGPMSMVLLLWEAGFWEPHPAPLSLISGPRDIRCFAIVTDMLLQCPFSIFIALQHLLNSLC